MIGVSSTFLLPISSEIEMLAQNQRLQVCEMFAYAVVADVTSKYKQDEEQRVKHEVLHGPITLVMS